MHGFVRATGASLSGGGKVVPKFSLPAKARTWKDLCDEDNMAIVCTDTPCKRKRHIFDTRPLRSPPTWIGKRSAAVTPHCTKRQAIPVLEEDDPEDSMPLNLLPKISVSSSKRD